MQLDAIVVVPPLERDEVITGLTLAERARRVVERAGVARDRIHLVRQVSDLAVVALRPGGGLLVVRAQRQLVAPELLAPLRIGEAGARIAVDDDGTYAGAVRVGDGHAAALLRALRADLGGGERIAAMAASAETVTVGPWARHPAATPLERQAARAWQWYRVGERRGAARALWRRIRRPVTRLFLRLPLAPSAITLLAIAASLVGVLVSADASWRMLGIGAASLVLAAILDGVAGDVARLRLETTCLFAVSGARAPRRARGAWRPAARSTRTSPPPRSATRA